MARILTVTAYFQVTDGRIDYIVFLGDLQERFATDVKASRWIDKATVLQVLKSQVFEIDGNDVFLPPPSSNKCLRNNWKRTDLPQQRKPVVRCSFMLVLYSEIAKFDLSRLTAPVSVFGFYAIVYMYLDVLRAYRRF